MRLYRPVGLEELRLIYESKLSVFPPRLPEQPIFYPVLHRVYAQQIARDWNTQTEPYAGYVTYFEIDEPYASRFEQKVVGSSIHEELWVPAEELSEFNSHIQKQISIVDAYFGSSFVGFIPTNFKMKGLNAFEQLRALSQLYAQSEEDLRTEIMSNATAIFLHFSLWQQEIHRSTLSATNDDARLLPIIQHMWNSMHSQIPLGLQ